MTSQKKLDDTSKWLCYVLRHKPESIGIELDAHGWAVITDILNRTDIERTLIDQTVFRDSKNRFSISGDGLRIRANQGHSINVDLELEVLAPPELLYHGTATRFKANITRQGLLSKTRQHVHMCEDLATAMKVGARHGAPTVILIDALKMYEAGHKFYKSVNGVWLTDAVPVKYLWG